MRVFNFFPFLNKKIVVSLSICIFLFSVGCKKVSYLENTYKIDFKTKNENIISEIEYGKENSKYWQVINNNIECLVSKKNEKINLISRQLASHKGDAEMKVRVGFFNQEISNLNKNWAGFNIGFKKNILGNDNYLNQKKGINIGLCTNGALFIGAPSPNHKNNTIVKTLNKGVDLKVLIVDNNDTYTIDFSVLDIETGKTLGRISKKDIATEQITGELALLSNFESTIKNKANTTKSVWFKNWEIKGSKVAMLHDPKNN